jgi:hypothetical protein
VPSFSIRFLDSLYSLGSLNLLSKKFLDILTFLSSYHYLSLIILTPLSHHDISVSNTALSYNESSKEDPAPSQLNSYPDLYPKNPPLARDLY